MQTIERPGTTRVGAGHVTAAAIATFVVYILVLGLEGTGRHFVELGAMRVVLFGALLAFAVPARTHERRFGRAGLVIAGCAAVAFLAGGIGAVATDGWSFDVFADNAPADPPWYAYVIGLSGILFAVGTILVGIAGRSRGWLAGAVILGGALFPAAFALQGMLGLAGAHTVWLVPWMVLAVGLIRSPDHGARSGRQPA